MPRQRRQLDYDDETISFEAAIGGRSITIILDREAIEHCLKRSSTTPEDRLGFMLQNRQRLIDSAEQYICQVNNGEGIMLPGPHILDREL